MENYEQKYKQAIERCKSWIRGEHPECFTEAQKAGEFIFPELKESEDERIRKGLIKGLSAMRDIHKHQTFSDDAINIDDAIAWLEKQKPSQQMIAGAAKEAIFPDYTNINVPQKDWAESKQEWSEEDEKMIFDLIDLLNGGKTIIPTKTYINWLNAIKNRAHLQLKQCDEKDEKIREGLINMLSQDKELHGAEINWLKSIKPNHWKPSEEQMEALKYFISFHKPQANAAVEGWKEFKNLESLYNDLKLL